jgi:hypothetical protein
MKNPDYAKVKRLLETGFYSTFSEMMADFHKDTIIQDMPISWKALTRRLSHIGYFSLEEIAAIASLIGVEPDVIAQLAFKEMAAKKKPRKK